MPLPFDITAGALLFGLSQRKRGFSEIYRPDVLLFGVENGLCGAAAPAVVVAEEQGGGIDHESVADSEAAGEILRRENVHTVRVNQTDIVALFPVRGIAVGLMLVRNGACLLYTSPSPRD